MKPLWILLVALFVALVAVPVSAQPIISAKSGIVAKIQGTVFLDDQARSGNNAVPCRIGRRMLIYCVVAVARSWHPRSKKGMRELCRIGVGNGRGADAGW